MLTSKTMVKSYCFPLPVSNPLYFIFQWFRWISQVTHGDHNPMGKGKRYNVLFITTPIIFEINTFTAENDEFQISFDSNTILRPSFELRVFQTCRFLAYPRTKVTISLNFRRSSMLFRITIGKILQNVARERMKEALQNLDYIFKYFTDYNLHKML